MSQPNANPSAFNQIASEEEQRRFNQKRLYWLCIFLWLLVAWFIADQYAYHKKFRVNDLSFIPGAGMVMRDRDGTFYHVNSAGRAKAIYPKEVADSLSGVAYTQECLDCSLVTGEQLSQTNDVCASAVPAELPTLTWEVPCGSWAILGDGKRILWIGFFAGPLILLWVLSVFISTFKKAQQPRKPVY